MSKDSADSELKKIVLEDEYNALEMEILFNEETQDVYEVKFYYYDRPSLSGFLRMNLFRQSARRVKQKVNADIVDTAVRANVGPIVDKKS